MSHLPLANVPYILSRSDLGMPTIQRLVAPVRSTVLDSLGIRPGERGTPLRERTASARTITECRILCTQP